MSITDLLVVGIFVSFLIGYTIGCIVGITEERNKID